MLYFYEEFPGLSLRDKGEITGNSRFRLTKTLMQLSVVYVSVQVIMEAITE